MASSWQEAGTCTRSNAPLATGTRVKARKTSIRHLQATVTLPTHSNVVQIVRRGGFMPTTAGNPQPFGMPPYGQVLSNDDIAAVITFIRQSWGNSGSPVSSLDVLHVR